MDHLVLLLTGIGFATIACQWVAWQLRLPSILFLLLVGVLVGPTLGLFHPDQIFGALLFPMVSLSVAIILFEGSLSLKLNHIQGHGKTVRNLISIGFISTVILSAVAAHYFLHFDWKMAVMLGTITAVSGPTVIKPMLRSINPNQRIAKILHWEGILIDPVGALMAVLIFGAITSLSESHILAKVALHFVLLTVNGLFWGLGLGYFMGVAIRRHWLPDFLNNIFALVMVLIAFTVSEYLFEGSGLLAVTVMGVLVANMRRVHIEEILDFKESLSILLISVLFIVLAARIEFANINRLGWGIIWFLLALQFIIRPLTVLLSSANSTLNWREKILLAWIAPRGIVCAAVAALFGLLFQADNLGDGRLLVLVSFIIIATTVVFQSATGRLVAKLLNVNEPEASGFLIIGANNVARTIAKPLQELGVKIMLADTYWDNVRQARLDGLPCYFGNPVSHHAERNLNLTGIGKMLGLSPQHVLNGLSSMRYRREFGRSNIYSLPSGANSKADAEKHSVPEKHSGKTLFGYKTHFHELAQWLNQGGTIKQTKLTDHFTWENYVEHNKENSIPLFTIDPKGKINIISPQNRMNPGTDWTVIALSKQEK